MNVLVTGGVGFLGSHCVDALKKNGHTVIILDDLSGGSLTNVADAGNVIVGSVVDPRTVERVFETHAFDAVIHCAAFASENLSHNLRRHTYESIVIGGANIVNACVNFNVKLLVAMSSIAVYGRQPPPFFETDPVNPIDPYGAAKCCIEADIRAAKDVFGLDYVVFRPHNIIGPRQSLADRTRNVVSIFIQQALAGKPMTIFGTGLQTRAFSAVQPVAACIAASIERPACWNQVINVGGNHSVSVLDVAHMVAKAVGVEPQIELLPERHEAKHAHSNHGLATSYFEDLLVDTDLQAAIDEMVVAAKRCDGSMKPFLFRPEIEHGLPDVWRGLVIG